MQQPDKELHMSIRLRALLMGVATLGATGLAACGNGPPAGASGSGSSGGGGCSIGKAGASGLGSAGTKVSATDQLQFSPASQTAKVGQVVEWSNTGSVPHTITFDASNAQCLNDALINPGATWEVKFTAPGTYTYKCTIHPGMNGTLTVSG
jgi:plastocyanin